MMCAGCIVVGREPVHDLKSRPAACSCFQPPFPRTPSCPSLTLHSVMTLPSFATAHVVDQERRLAALRAAQKSALDEKQRADTACEAAKIRACAASVAFDLATRLLGEDREDMLGVGTESKVTL